MESTRAMRTTFLVLLASLLAVGAAGLPAQTVTTTTTTTVSTNLVVPQWHRVLPPVPPHPWPHPRPRPLPPPALPGVELAAIDTEVAIADRQATTTMVFTMRNPGPRPQEAEVLAPVPAGASLRSFSIEGAEGKFSATLMRRDEARRIYDEIVRRLIDPGLLEFAGTGLVKSSVFPVPPNGTTRARLVYEEFLPEDAGRIDYALPRTEGSTTNIPWSVSLVWKVEGGAASLYCPSHPADIHHTPDGTATLALKGLLQAGALRVSAVRAAADRPALSLAAYPPDEGEDGYFVLLVAPPAGHGAPALKREVTLVFDRSGSMAGGKLDQVRAAALQIVEGLDQGESFNVISYNENVKPLFEAPRRNDPATTATAREFLAATRPSGGTNLHGALAAALARPPTEGLLPVVIFLTDGLPTVGETLEKRIRDDVAAANAARRRIFGFGVGVDVNTPLLARLADDSRATATFVLPGEDVEMKVLSVFRRLSGPVVADPVLGVRRADGSEAPGRIDDVLPALMPDLFAGDSRVVVGRYRGDDKLTFTVRGRGAAGEVAATLEFDPKSASRSQAHVPRLWATRRIAALTDALRDLGSEGNTATLPAPDDPKARELVEEIVRLSLKHGVLSEYTAFLARDGQSFDPRPQATVDATWHNYRQRALPMRSGAGAFNQDFNNARAKEAAFVDRANHYLDANLQPAQAGGVQQMADRTFFQNGAEWTDSRLAGRALPEAVEIRVGTPEFDHLVDRLVANHRQALLALPGDIVVLDDGKAYRIRRGS